MTTDATLGQVIKNLGKIDLAPADYLRVVSAVALALLREHGEAAEDPDRPAHAARKPGTSDRIRKSEAIAIPQAMEFLKTFLADGPKTPGEVEDAAKAAGISLNALTRAKAAGKGAPAAGRQRRRRLARRAALAGVGGAYLSGRPGGFQGPANKSPYVASLSGLVVA